VEATEGAVAMEHSIMAELVPKGALMEVKDEEAAECPE
jgi:hypothetical protein